MTATPLAGAEADALLAPLDRFSRLALAVSGGPDSLALLHLAAAWLRRHASGDVFVLTVDHGLRPQSRDEAEMVGRVARSLGLPHAILPWRHGAIHAGVQARARRARYDLMAAYCTAHGIPALVTAHHLDDQAETFLMRLKRGSGLDGLAAIPEHGTWAGMTLLRPLLDVSKARLIATVEAAGLAYITDPSNADTRFERGRLREAAAELARLGLTAEAIARSARRLRRARSALEAAADRFLAEHGERSAAGFASVSCAALRAGPQEVSLRALARLIATVGGTAEPVRLVKLEALYAALSADPGKGHTLGGCQIVPSQDRLFVFREVRKTGLHELELHPGERMLWDNRFRLELGKTESEPVTVRALGEDGVQALTTCDGFLQAWPRLAARALPSCWRAGGLLCLPEFGQDARSSDAPLSRHEGALDCRATFLWG